MSRQVASRRADSHHADSRFAGEGEGRLPPGGSMPARIELRQLSRQYDDGQRSLRVLSDVSLTIEPGEFVAVTGPSGSGKSTLLGLVAGLDRPTAGSVHIDSVVVSELSEDALAAFRGRHIGFVFQSFQLIPTLTALENVRVPAELMGRFDWAARAEALLAKVGLGERLGHFPAQLSGGEMQRVAIARAAVNQPGLILADEPTGNLDRASGLRVVELLTELNQTATLVLVTHDAELAGQASREIVLRDGRVREVVQHR